MNIPYLLFSTCSAEHQSIDLVRQERESLLQRNSEWEYSCLSDNDCDSFLGKYYPGRVYEAYKRLNPDYGAARADLVRYCLIYKFGGMYLDIKSTSKVPLRDLIRKGDEYILGQWDNGAQEPHAGWGLHQQVNDIKGGEYQQWFIIGRPRHPFLESAIKAVTRNILEFPRWSKHTFGRMAVLELTGPIAYSRAIQDYINQKSLIRNKNYRVIMPHQEGLVYSIFEDREYLLDPLNVSTTTSSDTHRNCHYMINHYSRKNTPLVLAQDDASPSEQPDKAIKMLTTEQRD